MKTLKKIISIFLAILFLFSACVISPMAEQDSILPYTVEVVSSEFIYDTCLIYVDAHGQYYMSIEDIARYTRSSYEEQYDKATLVHGTRCISLDAIQQKVSEFGRFTHLDMLIQDEGIFVHAAPILSYLGATCELEDNRLIIDMPAYTLWETMLLVGTEQYILKEDTFNSEFDVKFRLFWNWIAKFMDSGFGDAVTSEYHALLLPLQLDVAKYDLYLDAQVKENMKNHSLLVSMADKGAGLDSLVDFSSGAKNVHKLVSVFRSAVKPNSVESTLLKNAKDFGKLTTSASIATIASISETIKTVDDSFEMVSAATAHMPEDLRFYNNLDYAQTKLQSTQANIQASLVSNTLLKAITEELSDNAQDIIESNQEKYFAKLGRSSGLKIWETWELSLDISKAIHKAIAGEDNIFNYTTAETNVIQLLRLRDDLVTTMNVLSDKASKESYSNIQHLEDARLLRIFYYRTLIALNEQFEAMIEAQKGKEDLPEMQELIATLHGHSNLYAEKIYALTIADVSTRADISHLAYKNAWDGALDLSALPDFPDLPDTPDDAGHSGKVGDITWSYDADSATLTFSGSGAIPDYHSDYDPAPWMDLIYFETIECVIIEEGITAVGEFAFGGGTYAKFVVPHSMEKVGYAAFDCASIETIFYYGTEEDARKITIEQQGNETIYDAYLIFLGNGGNNNSDPSRPCLSSLSPIYSEVYMENMGDSYMFTLGTHECRNGNVSVNGSQYWNGFEVWLARWNNTDEKSFVINTYDIDNQYARLTGKTGLIQSYNTYNFNTIVSIIGDNRVLYEQVLTPENYDYSFDVDISGVKELTIKVQDIDAVSGGTSFALYDLYLHT